MKSMTMQQVSKTKIEPWRPAVPASWVMLTSELTDLWVGGKALYLILAYSIMLGIQTFVLATNFELSLFTPQEMVFEILKSSIQVSLLIGLIIGSDSISGERERATLEGLLLTPASRRQIVLGKFLASLSPWPAALCISLPFIFVLAQGEVALGPAFLWSALVGILLVPAFTALGMIVSFWCNSNKTSFFISLGIFLVVILMGQVIGTTRVGVFGQMLLFINPIPSGFDFLSKMLVANGTFAEFWIYLKASFVFTAVVIGFLFYYLSPRLMVEEGRMSRLWSKLSRRVGLAVIVCLVLAPSVTSAQALYQSEAGDLQMSISIHSIQGKTGDTINFDTVVTNTSAQQSPPVIAAMNIINLSKTGDVVDPEDWSPQRTQYIDSLGPNQSTTLSWTVNAVLDGDFMVYVVGIPQPQTAEDSSQVVASPGLHLSVEKFTSLNPSGILPFVIGVPVVLVIAISLLFRMRRRQIDTGGSS
ncbi:MAG: ABC transporter permease [Anaerolineae bacterium]|nr:ABC transporter permease [Anaerolineae bacterium]